MPSLRLFVSNEIQARLDAAAPSYGGRAALLRVLLEKEIKKLDPLPAPKGRNLRTFIRLSEAETRAVVAHAAARGLKASTWIRMLVRRRLHGEPRFLRSEELALYAIHDDLAALVRRLNSLSALASQADIVEGVRQVRSEVQSALVGLRRAFEGNLAYWAASADGGCDGL